MKTILFIEANTTGTGMKALILAKRMGLNPVFITKDPDRYIGLRDTECMVLIVDTDRLDHVKAVIEQNLDVNRLTGIMTTSDFYLEHVARLSQYYRLNGNTLESIQSCRNKALTRTKLEDVNIDQPQFVVVYKAEEIESAIHQIGMPCVVKPVDDSASYNVRLCNTAEEAKVHITSILETTHNVRGQKSTGLALVEEFLDGPEYSVEMLATNGEIFTIGITEKKVTGAPSFVECQHIFPASLPKDFQMQIIDVTKRVIECLGIKYGATHTEIKLIHGKVYIIEINARLAGGMIPELIQNATGIDVLKQHIGCLANEVIGIHSYDYKQVSGIRFFVSQEEGVVDMISGMHEVSNMTGVNQIVLSRAIGDKVSLPSSAYDRVGYAIVTASSHTEVAASLDEINSIIRLKVRKGGIPKQ